MIFGSAIVEEISTLGNMSNITPIKINSFGNLPSNI
jgi:hypothetical protein